MLPAIERKLIDTAALRCSYFEVPWDTAIFGDRVVQLEGFELLSQEPAADAAFASYELWARERAVALEVGKLSAGRLREVAWLQKNGFRWIETMYYPSLSDLREVPLDDSGPRIALRAMDPAEVHEVQSIAEQAFVTSRFSIDPQICKQRGAARYAQWVCSSAADLQQHVLVALIDGDIGGFFIVQERETQGQKHAYWHLTAVAASFQGRGLGKRLWRKVMNWHAERGCSQLSTAISGHNLPVIGLYGQLGFRFVRAEVTLHRGGLPPLDHT